MRSSIRARRAYTLVEVMIALVITVTVMGIVLQTMMSMSSYVALGQAQDELALDAKVIFAEVGSDLSTSGWHFPSQGGPYSGVTFAIDRGLRYFPCVTQPVAGVLSAAQGTLSGQSSAFPELDRTAAYINFSELAAGDLPGHPADAMSTPAMFEAEGGKRYRESFYARSQELIFLRCTVNSWNTSGDVPLVTAGKLPSSIQRPLVNFGREPTARWMTPDNHAALGVLHASGWQEIGENSGKWIPRVADRPYGVVIEGAHLDTHTTGTTGVILQWEETGQISFQEQADANLRVFTYAVVPTPRGQGYGRLVRAFVAPVGGAPPARGSSPGEAIAINGDQAVVVDTVLSNHVVRVLFETARHDPGLQLNQVRVRIFLARRVQTIGDNHLTVKSMIETTFTMRAKNNSVDQSWDAPNIGSANPFTY
jgi:type II secretory pathway pseudopilin PulG